MKLFTFLILLILAVNAVKIRRNPGHLIPDKKGFLETRQSNELGLVIARSKRCLEFTSTAPPSLKPCNKGSSNQQFTFQDGKLRAPALDVCLTSEVNSSVITSPPCETTATQQNWAMNPTDAGGVTFEGGGSAEKKLCLGSQDNNVTLLDCTASSEEIEWIFFTLPTTPPPTTLPPETPAPETPAPETYAPVTSAPEPPPQSTTAPQPAPEPAPQPAPEPAPQPAPEPAPQPAPQPAPEPAPQPAPEPAPQPAPEPAPQPAPEPAPQPAPEPAPQPAPEPAPQPAPEPAPESYEPKDQQPEGPQYDKSAPQYPEQHQPHYPEQQQSPYPQQPQQQYQQQQQQQQYQQQYQQQQYQQQYQQQSHPRYQPEEQRQYQPEEQRRQYQSEQRRQYQPEEQRQDQPEERRGQSQPEERRQYQSEEQRRRYQPEEQRQYQPEPQYQQPEPRKDQRPEQQYSAQPQENQKPEENEAVPPKPEAELPSKYEKPENQTGLNNTEEQPHPNNTYGGPVSDELGTTPAPSVSHIHKGLMATTKRLTKEIERLADSIEILSFEIGEIQNALDTKDYDHLSRLPPPPPLPYEQFHGNSNDLNLPSFPSSFNSHPQENSEQEKGKVDELPPLPPPFVYTNEDGEKEKTPQTKYNPDAYEENRVDGILDDIRDRDLWQRIVASKDRKQRKKLELEKWEQEARELQDLADREEARREFERVMAERRAKEKELRERGYVRIGPVEALRTFQDLLTGSQVPYRGVPFFGPQPQYAGAGDSIPIDVLVHNRRPLPAIPFFPFPLTANQQPSTVTEYVEPELTDSVAKDDATDTSDTDAAPVAYAGASIGDQSSKKSADYFTPDFSVLEESSKSFETPVYDNQPRKQFKSKSFLSQPSTISSSLSNVDNIEPTIVDSLTTIKEQEENMEEEHSTPMEADEITDTATTSTTTSTTTRTTTQNDVDEGSSILEIGAKKAKSMLKTPVIYEDSKIPPFVQQMEMEDSIVRPSYNNNNNGDSEMKNNVMIDDKPVAIPNWAIDNFVTPDFK